ncbi:Hypothetical predicted protein, partial [Pelobates cultripes]
MALACPLEKIHRDAVDYQKDQVYTWYQRTDNRQYRPNKNIQTRRWRSDTEGDTSSSSVSSSSRTTSFREGYTIRRPIRGGVITRGTIERKKGRPPLSRRHTKTSDTIARQAGPLRDISPLTITSQSFTREEENTDVTSSQSSQGEQDLTLSLNTGLKPK